jgi:hypothetical protein
MQGIKGLIKSMNKSLRSIDSECGIDNLDVDAILEEGRKKGIEAEEGEYLENKTLDDITQSIFDIIREHVLEKESHRELCDKLAGYRYVERVCDIRVGRNSRWIGKVGNAILHNGGIAVNIRIGDSIYILCKTPSSRYPFITCDFNKVVLFQKLTEEECFILMANNMAK